METPLVHEERYRTPELMGRIAQARLVVCGAGAVGSNVAANLVRQGFARLTVIDDDRVEARNLSTQTYRRDDLGAVKVTALRNDLYRTFGVAIEAVDQRLTEKNAARWLGTADVVIDGLDNAPGRAIVASTSRALGVACLHVGLAADYAEVIWEPDYRVPQPAGPDPCDYPMARNLVVLATAVASEVIVDFLAGHPKSSYTITLGDLTIREYPG